MVKQIYGFILIMLLGYLNVYSQESMDSTNIGVINNTKIVIYRNKKILQFYAGDSLVKTYKVAVGKKGTPTPIGEFKIVNKVKNPTWYPKGKDPVSAGTENPVGTRWMGLDAKGYGIHGTNSPNSIGKSASHGCVRMAKKDVEELFQIVSVGTAVQIMESDKPQIQPDAQLIASSLDTVNKPLNSSHITLPIQLATSGK